MHELADGFRHRCRLILDPRQRDASRQVGAYGLDTAVQGPPERDDVAALGHRHTERDHGLPLVANFDGRRIDHAAADLGDIGQLQRAGQARGRVGGTDRQAPDVGDGTESAGHPHLQVLRASVEQSGAFDSVLRRQLAQHLVHVEPELGQALLRDLDEDLLGLRSKHLDLRNIGHTQQLRAQVLGKDTQLLVAKTVRRQRKDRAVDIAKIVVEERAQGACRQRAAHVGDLLAHLVPAVADLLGRRAVLQLEDGERFTRLGIAAHRVCVRHLLQRALDLVGDLFGDLLGGGAGPERLHHHRPERERRVFVLPELKIGGRAQQHQHHHQVAGQCGMFQRPA